MNPLHRIEDAAKTKVDRAKCSVLLGNPMDSFRRNNVNGYLEGDEIKPSGQSRTDVEKYAGLVAKAGGFTAGVDGDVYALVRKFGGRVHTVNTDDLLDGRTGAVYVHGKFDFDVQVPDHTSPRRDRFTIAHELGHYFLHSRQGAQPIIAFRLGSGRREWEANWFAAALLMPKAAFRTAVADGLAATSLAQHFGVSLDAANVRLQTV